MEKIELSKRLAKVAEFVKRDEIILDIGSDHAYLPIYLVEEKLVAAAIAGEIVRGPYEKARNKVARHDLTDKISIRLGSGFDVLEIGEEMGTIFICGMGGILISEIIEKGMKDNKIAKDSRLVLQANNKEDLLRKLLMGLNFEIIDESIVKENDKYYEIIVSNKSERKIEYNQEELFFGPQLLKAKSQVFRAKWQRVLENNQAILKKLDQMKHQTKIEELRDLNKRIEKVIK